jgi:phage terminase small subunit
MTPKQQRFVEEYLVDLNGTQAAIRAGYSPKTANEQAARLLANVSVQQAVAAGREARAERTKVTADWVLERLVEVTERCMQHEPVLDRKGQPVVIVTGAGETAAAYVFDAKGANGALGLIGRHLGMFTDKHEVSGPGGGPMEVVDRPPNETREEWIARRNRELGRVGAATGTAD